MKYVKYEIDGCAISTASASLLSEDINGTSFSDFKQKCDRKYVCDNLLNVKLIPLRIKCALLIRDTISKSTD
jgi:nitrogen fixation NifU-like protein